MLQSKDTEWLDSYQKKDPYIEHIVLYKRPTSDLGTYTYWKRGAVKGHSM